MIDNLCHIYKNEITPIIDKYSNINTNINKGIVREKDIYLFSYYECNINFECFFKSQ